MPAQTIILMSDAPAVVGNLTIQVIEPAGEAVRLVVTDLAEAAPGRTFRERFRRPANCTDAQLAQVRHLAAAWCEHVTRLTVLNQARFGALHGRLQDGYSVADCLGAIHLYGRSDWHREHNAWLDLSRFFRPEKLDTWIRLAHEERDAEARRDQRRPSASPTARRLVRDAARAMEVKAETAELLSYYRALSPDEQQDILRQAVSECGTLGVHRGRLSPTLDCYPVRQQVLVICRRLCARPEGGADG